MFCFYLFRALHQSLAALALQTCSGEDIFGEKPEPAQEQPLLPGHLPPSFPLAFPVSCRGMNGPRLHEALEVLSEADPWRKKSLGRRGGWQRPEGRAQFGHLRFEGRGAGPQVQELLIIASYALDKVPEDMKSLVDCAGLLKEVLRCEVELCRSKWKLVKLQLSAFERASLTKWDIAQRIMDVLARRPCFDVATGSFRQGYAALIAALESRAQLQQMLGRNLAVSVIFFCRDFIIIWVCMKLEDAQR
eukprot:s18_g45.t1